MTWWRSRKKNWRRCPCATAEGRQTAQRQEFNPDVGLGYINISRASCSNFSIYSLLTPKTIGFTASIISKLLILVELFKNFLGGDWRRRVSRDFAFDHSHPLPGNQWRSSKKEFPIASSKSLVTAMTTALTLA
jgi:hypothetical protein